MPDKSLVIEKGELYNPRSYNKKYKPKCIFLIFQNKIMSKLLCDSQSKWTLPPFLFPSTRLNTIQIQLRHIPRKAMNSLHYVLAQMSKSLTKV